MIINTASHKKGTTSRVANSEFQIFCYWVMGPYEETPMTPKILVPATLGGPNGPFLVPKQLKLGKMRFPKMCFFATFWVLLTCRALKYINKGWIKPKNLRVLSPERRYWAWQLTVFEVPKQLKLGKIRFPKMCFFFVNFWVLLAYRPLKYINQGWGNP